jgi:hypothetical protein
VAAGASKVPGLVAALSAGYISDLIVDNRTAVDLVRRAPLRPGIGQIGRGRGGNGGGP